MMRFGKGDLSNSANCLSEGANMRFPRREPVLSPRGVRFGSIRRAGCIVFLARPDALLCQELRAAVVGAGSTSGSCRRQGRHKRICLHSPVAQPLGPSTWKDRYRSFDLGGRVVPQMAQAPGIGHSP
jgi:hypothetical protein